MKKTVFIGLLLVLIIAVSIAIGQTAEPEVRNVVMIVLDGCRADYIDLAEMPNLQELKKNGMTYTNAWVGEMINNTPTSHAALQTGLYPKNNGIIGFYWKLVGKNIWLKPSKWDSVLSGDQGKIMMKNGAIGFIGYLKERGDFLSASVSGHKFYAAEAWGGPLCDIVAFPSWGIENRLTEEQKQYGDWQTLFRDEKSKSVKLAYVNGKSPSKDVIKDIQTKNISREFGDDESAVEIALSIIRHQKPRILLINMPHLDHLGHKAAGGYLKWREVMGRHMKKIDDLIGKVLSEYKKNGQFDNTLFIVLSDHGMAVNGKNADGKLIKKLLGKKILSLQKGFSSSMPWFWNIGLPKEEFLNRCIKLAKKNIPFLRAMYYKEYIDGKYQYKIVPGSENCMNSELDEAYKYLLDTQGNENAPDLYLIPYEHTLVIGDVPANMQGDHNSPTWTVQHIPLIISGPGIKKNGQSDYPARLIDLAPTILKLFNIKASMMDGIVLSDALTQSDENDKKKQDSMMAFLMPFVSAIKKASDEDLKLIYPDMQHPTRIP